MLAGENRFKVVAINDSQVESEASEVVVFTDWVGERPKLHILAVGISKYENHRLDLKFSRHDAEMIGKRLVLGNKSTYAEVNLIMLCDSDASQKGISRKLDELEALPPQDTVVIYLAGHGDTLDDEWYFIPYDLRHPENGGQLRRGGISSSSLQYDVARIGARRIFLVLDACKAGSLVGSFAEFETHRPMALLSRLAGIHVISATTNNQYASEYGRLGHGLFTYTLLEGLQGEADKMPRNGEISVSEIIAYVEHEMPRLIDELELPVQNPVTNSYGEDFSVGFTGKM